ncbi:MAG: RidA family protein [Acidobacteria bacterium]|nr:RidA family protein [Acidobacteriota bacterium]
MLILNKRGNYSFLKGLGPYSAGVIASPGYEIEHVRLKPARGLKSGFAFVEAHLQRLNRPRQALCGMELRSPRPFSFPGFAEFNQGYIDVLKSWDVFLDGLNPVARTNVAPEFDPPTEAVLFGFSYTVPSTAIGKSFVVAGASELPEGSLDPLDVVRRGETSAAALEEKTNYVLGLMEGRLNGMELAWADVAHTGVYTVHNIYPYLATSVLRRMGAAQLQGLTWYFSRPPIVSIEYELDLRACRKELVL